MGMRHGVGWKTWVTRTVFEWLDFFGTAVSCLRATRISSDMTFMQRGPGPPWLFLISACVLFSFLPLIANAEKSKYCKCYAFCTALYFRNSTSYVTIFSIYLDLIFHASFPAWTCIPATKANLCNPLSGAESIFCQFHIPSVSYTIGK